MKATLINGQAYSFVDASFKIAGVQLYNTYDGVPFASIEYTNSQQKTFNYENSKRPTSVSYGKITCSGSITFHLDAVENLRETAFKMFGSNSLTDLPNLECRIIFSNGGKRSVHTLRSMMFTEEGISGSDGDDVFTVTCPFVCAEISYGNAVETYNPLYFFPHA